MKRFPFVLALGICVAAAAVAPRAVAADKEAPPAAHEEKEGKKNTSVVVLAGKPEDIHRAILEALAAIGADVKKDTPDYIEGKRSNKIGMAVGSGGEKLLVSLSKAADGKTEVKIVTKKTMMGYVGQKLWNEEVAAHLRNAVK
jgi:hypothetical protein